MGIPIHMLFLFLSIEPTREPHTRKNMLTAHLTHQSAGNRRVRTFCPGTFYPGFASSGILKFYLARGLNDVSQEHIPDLLRL